MQFDFGQTQIEVNVDSKSALLSEVRRRFAATEGFALATINVDHLVKLRGQAVFREAYAAQDLIVADGNPIVWLSKLAGRPVGLVPGSDLVLPLCETAAATNVTVALVGATPSALDGAEATLNAKLPGLRIAAKIAPPMGFDPQSAASDEILDQVAASGAGLCLIALGAPKQELFAARGRERAPGVGFASIGASLDFLAGTQTRAPMWVRKIAMEWLWRMMSNPRRLAKRYIDCFLVLPGHAWTALRLRRSTSNTAA